MRSKSTTGRLVSYLTLHAVRGGPIKAKATAVLLGDPGVTRLHNRPHTSNDNPFSHSQFETFKSQPRFTKRFGCIEELEASAVPSLTGTTNTITIPGSV